MRVQDTKVAQEIAKIIRDCQAQSTGNAPTHFKTVT